MEQNQQSNNPEALATEKKPFKAKLLRWLRMLLSIIMESLLQRLNRKKEDGK